MTAYYYIDDISVIDCNDTANAIQESFNSANAKIYPNPSTGIVEISLESQHQGQTLKLNIFDLTGRLVSTFDLRSEAQQQINLQLNNRLYLYNISTNKIPFANGKLIIAQ